MPNDSDIADDLIAGSLNRSKSYHADYGQLTYGKIKALAAASPPIVKARQLKKLIDYESKKRDDEHDSNTEVAEGGCPGS